MSETPHTPLRIGYVIWSLGLGGAEQVVIRLAGDMARRGHRVSIFTLNDPGTFAAAAQAHGVEVISVAKRSRYDISVLWRLRQAFRARQLDVVHTHLWGANVWGRIAARWARVPRLVVTEHNVDTWKRPHHFVIDRCLAPWASSLVAVSHEVRMFYERHGVGRGRWQVVYNGVDASTSPARRRGEAYAAMGIEREEPVVGWIGRLVPAKAPEVLLDAVERAVKAMPSLKVLVIGDGPLRARIEAEVARRGLQRTVQLTGLRRDVPELLAGMDALVFSSEREGLSMAMLEAMAAGVPVIATRVGGTPELIEDGVSGLLAEPGRPQELADRLVELLTHPERAAAMCTTARTRVEHAFSLTRMVEAHDALYRGQRPITVACVIDHLDAGGAQRQLVELVRHLPRERFAASVISLSTDRIELVEALRRDGVPVVTIPQAGTWSWRCFGRLVRHLRRLQPDIVYTWLFTADLYGRLAARLVRVPVVISAVRSVEPDKPRRYVAVDRLLAKITDAFTVNARAIADVLARRERIARSKIHFVPNGVDLSTFDPARANGALRRRLQIASEAPVIGIVGRLVPVKDHATFLQAAVRVAREQPQARFLLVGRGPLRQEMEQLAIALGLGSRVHVLDAEARMPEVFASLDIAVVSSRYEGCSNVILEAMAMGKPVVATAVGGTPEFVAPGETGLLVPPQDPERLGDALLALVQDRARAERMGQAGRAVIEARFSVQRMAEETAAVFATLLERRRLRCNPGRVR